MFHLVLITIASISASSGSSSEQAQVIESTPTVSTVAQDTSIYTGRYWGVHRWGPDWTYFTVDSYVFRIRTSDIPASGMPPSGSNITLTGVTPVGPGVGTHDYNCTGIR